MIFLQVHAVHELHDEEVRVFAFADVEDRDDVRVVQARREPRLVQEHLDEALVLREVRQHALDRDALLEALHADGFAEVHLRHAAGFEALDDAVLVFGRRPSDEQRDHTSIRPRSSSTRLWSFRSVGVKPCRRLLS